MQPVLIKTQRKPLGSILGLTQSSILKDTDTHFNQGTLSSSVISGTGASAIVQLQGDGGAGWLDANWFYRQPVVLTNTGSLQTNYAVRMPISYDSSMQADFDDLRFANASGTLLDYWLQSKTDSTSAVVWVEVDSLAASADTTIYMYYGNAGVSSTSNGSLTFPFFDNFDDNSLDATKWTKVDPRSKISESGGKLMFTYGSGSGNWDTSLYSISSFTRNDYAFEWDMRWTSDYTPYDAFMFGWKDDGAGVSYTNLVYGYYNQGDGLCTTNCNSYSYEDGSQRTPGYTWSNNTNYNIRLRMRASGGAYYEKSIDGGQNWALNYTSSYSTESTLHPAWMLYSGDYEVDNARVRKWMATEPTVAFGSEEMALSSTGTWESATDSNVIDLIWNGGWGDGSGSSTAFSATVANVSADATVTFAVRTATTAGGLSGAAYTTLGVAAGGTTFAKTKSELDALGLATGLNRYVQLKATLAQTNGINPQLDSLTLYYQADNDPPINPDPTGEPGTDSFIARNASGGDVPLTTDTWYNYPTPSFSWAGASDADSGVAGYLVYFGTNPATVPSTFQAGSTFTASSLINDTTYYLRIKTVDIAGNPSTAVWQPFIYKYDSGQPSNPSSLAVLPVGYTATNAFTFYWTDDGADSESTLSDYCFKTGTSDMESEYYTDQCASAATITNVPAYQNGANTFMVRSRDTAGNKNSSYKTILYYFNAVAPTAPRNVTITPAATLTGSTCTSLDNCFSVSWDAPQTFTGTIETYYYRVNDEPTLTENTATTSGETASRTLSARPLATLQGSNTFYLVAQDNTGNIEWDLFSETNFSALTTAPGIPLNIQITDSSNRDTGSYQLTLTWNAPASVGSGIDHYNVYRAIDGVTFSSVATVPGLASGYLDTGLTSGTEYSYKLTAEDNAANEGSYSSLVSETPTGRYTSPPDILVQPSVTPSILSATVTWRMERTCQGYVQIRPTDNDAYTEQGAGISSLDHGVTVVGLDPDMTYLYRIRCQDIDGNVGYSSEGSFRTNSAPSEPISLIAQPESNTENSFAFRWEEPADLGVTISHYLYSINQEPTESNITRIDATSLATGSYATQQGSNVLYVLAVDDAGNYNLANYASIEFIATTVAPGIPTNVSVADSSDRASNDFALTVRWARPSFGIVEKYNIYRSLDGEAYTKIATIPSTIYAESGLDTTQTYYYKITSEDNAGAESVFSTIVSRMPTGRFTLPPSYVGEPEVTVTSTTAKIRWETNRSSTSFISYGISDSLSESKGDLTNVLVHEVTLTGLTPSTLYHFKLQSFDEARDYGLDEALSEEYTLRTSIAPAISDLKVDDVRQSSALVTWQTTTVSTSIVSYGKTNSYGIDIADMSGSGTTIHTVKIDMLDSETLYHLKITGTDSEGNSLASDDYVFQTLAFPKIYNVAFQPVADASSATIKIVWETNVETDSIIEYAKIGEHFAEKVASTLTKEHEMILSDLDDNATYQFRAKGRDQYGNIAQSETTDYETPFDTRPPVIREIAMETTIIGNGQDAKAQLIISWKTDELATSQVEYGQGVGGTTYTSKTVEDSMLTNSHLVIVSDLTPSTPYHLRVVSKDSAGNTTQSVDKAVITGRATEGVLDIIVSNLQRTFGWLGNMNNIFDLLTK